MLAGLSHASEIHQKREIDQPTGRAGPHTNDSHTDSQGRGGIDQ